MITTITTTITAKMPEVWDLGILYERFRLENGGIAKVKSSIYRWEAYQRGVGSMVSVKDARGVAYTSIAPTSALRVGDRFTYTLTS